MVLLEWMEQFALQFGYLGVFLLSFIGALSIVIPIPYTLILYFLGAAGVLDPFLIAISGGVGAALGEFSGYVGGYYGRVVLSGERQKQMDYMMKVFHHYGFAAIFLFALTPLPDDLLFIPLGVMRYSFVKAFIPAFLGKLLMSFLLAYGGQLSIEFIEVVFGEAGLLGTVATTVLLMIIIVAMFRIDWEKVFERYVREESEKD